MSKSEKWRTSSFSGEENCVQLHGDLKEVRDSKNPGKVMSTGGVRPMVAFLRAGGQLTPVAN